MVSVDDNRLFAVVDIEIMPDPPNVLQELEESHQTFCMRQGKPLVRFKAHSVLLHPAVAPNVLPETGQTSCSVC